MILTTVLILGGLTAVILLGGIALVLVLALSGKKLPQLTSRPEASAWDKQVASDLLDEVVLHDAKQKVVDMLRRATGPAEATGQPAVKQPVA